MIDIVGDCQQVGHSTGITMQLLLIIPKPQLRRHRLQMLAARHLGAESVSQPILALGGSARNFGAWVVRIEPLKVAAHSSGSLSVPIHPMRRFFDTGGGEQMIAHAGPTLALTPNHGF